MYFLFDFIWWNIERWLREAYIIIYYKFMSKYLHTAVAASSIELIALNSGVLLSSASPVYETNIVGILNIPSTKYNLRYF